MLYKSPSKPRTKTSEKKKKRLIPLLIVLCLAAVVIILILLGVFGKTTIVAGNIFPDSVDAIDGHLPNMSEEEIMEQMQKVADESYLSFKINSRPVFETGNAAGDLNIENPSYNIYPIAIEIYLRETNELIYYSGGLMPNQYIANAQLSRALPAGSYDAVAYIYAYHPETKEYLGQSSAALVITVRQ